MEKRIMGIGSENGLIVGIGELLWDVYKEEKRPGGAPANFVYFCNQLGARTGLISAVGDDEEGRELLSAAYQKGIPIEHISLIKGIDTGQVKVSFGQDGIPEFEIIHPAAYHFIPANKRNLELMEKASLVCFGTLSLWGAVTSETLFKLLGHCSPNTIIILDLNLRGEFYTLKLIQKLMQYCNCLKLNEDELYILADLFHLKGMEPEIIRQLRQRFSIELLVLTKGKEGSVISCSGLYLLQKAEEVEVVDSVGAGDAFIAALATGLLKKKPLDFIQSFANRLAGYVCTQHGAMPPVPEYFKEWLNE